MRIYNRALAEKVFDRAILVFVYVLTAFALPEISRALEPVAPPSSFRTGTELPEMDITLPTSALLRLPASIEFPSNGFDDLVPICRFRSKAVSAGLSATGICNSVRQFLTIPRQLYYGDVRVEIEDQCLTLEDCYSGRGAASKEQCDDNFRADLESACRRSVSGCGNVLRQCLETVDGYVGAIIGFAGIPPIARESPPPRANHSVFGVPHPDPDDVAQQQSDVESWVYVGEFDGGWITRNFEVQEMISVGDVITVTNYVNVRSNHIRLDPDSGEWENAEKTGVLRPGDTVTVTAVENFGRQESAAHIWARISRR